MVSYVVTIIDCTVSFLFAFNTIYNRQVLLGKNAVVLFIFLVIVARHRGIL